MMSSHLLGKSVGRQSMLSGCKPMKQKKGRRKRAGKGKAVEFSVR